MRILTVIESLGRGGAEQALVNLLPELRNQGIVCEVAVLWPPYDLLDTLEDAGIKVHRLNLRHRWSLFEGLSKLSRLIRRGNFDIVHSHMFFAGIYAAACQKPNRVRMVVTYHNLDYDSYPADTQWKRVRKAADAWLMKHRVTGHVAVSHAVAAHYRQHLGVSNVEVIPNAFPTDQLKPTTNFNRDAVRRQFGIERDDFLLISPGRLVHEKGHRYIFEALNLLSDKGIRPKLLIVGNGPLREQLENEIVEKDLSTQVYLRAALPNRELMPIVEAADAFIIASTHEGFGLAPAEAMALECPVIATDVGGLPDLIENGTSGLLVAPGDVNALANGIQKLITDAELRHKLSGEGRRRIENRFSTRKIAERWKTYYSDLLRPN